LDEKKMMMMTWMTIIDDIWMKSWSPSSRLKAFCSRLITHMIASLVVRKKQVEREREK
jgi:hypothetical protein